MATQRCDHRGGTIGLSLTESFAAAGIHVRLCDETSALSREAHGRLEERARGHAEAGLIAAEVVDRAAAVEVAGDIPAAVHETDLVFEVVPEQLDLKRDVFAASDAAAPQDAIIATNASSLPIDELAASVDRPERFLGMHWFNLTEWPQRKSLGSEMVHPAHVLVSPFRGTPLYLTPYTRLFFFAARSKEQKAASNGQEGNVAASSI